MNEKDHFKMLVSNTKQFELVGNKSIYNEHKK